MVFNNFLLSPQFSRDQKERNASFEQDACYAGFNDVKKVPRSDLSLKGKTQYIDTIKKYFGEVHANIGNFNVRYEYNIIFLLLIFIIQRNTCQIYNISCTKSCFGSMHGCFMVV